MKTFINDIVMFSNSGDSRITADFLRKDVFIENLDGQSSLKGRGFRQIPRIYKIFHVVVSEIIEKNNLYRNVSRIGLISAYEYANLDSNIDFENEILKYGVSMVNPIKAPFTVCNSCAGWLAIKHKIQNLNLTVSSGRTSLISAMKIANDCLKAEEIDYCIILSANLNQGGSRQIESPKSFMKSEFATAILMSKIPELERICEVEEIFVNGFIENDEIGFYLQSLLDGQEHTRFIFDGNNNAESLMNAVDSQLSNREQCSYLPVFLQEMKLETNNEMTNISYIIYDKIGSIGGLKIRC
ncbi:MAG: hypothetical protein LBS69_04415 [Prevotellaceae bacterium]|jgi:hypothetical protein|nr:hypothetical protein [Prevotellaceae bacterium]